MSTITVTTNTNYAGFLFSDVDLIDFNSVIFASFATFASTQFDGVQIRPDVHIDGTDTQFAADTLSINFFVGSTVNASAWTFSNWGPNCSIEFNGSSNSDGMFGSTQRDIMHGWEGIDTLFGGAGNDELYGDEDNDSVNGGLSSDTLFGGTGDDTLYSRNDDLINGQVVFEDTPDILDGGDGTDLAYITRYYITDRLVINLSAGGGGADIGDGTTLTSIERMYIESGDGNDRLIGGALGDTIAGNYGNDYINGGAGDDWLHTGFGFDTILGGAGNDIITCENDFGNADVLDGGAGIDTLHLNRSPLFTDLVVNISNGGGGLDIGDGTKLTQFEILDFFSGSGNDRVTGAARADNLWGNVGNDLLVGNGGDDTLTGSDGNDILRGGLGNDILSGGNERDTLNGGQGHDTMTGGSDRDIFAYAGLSDSRVGAQRDLITDFEQGVDRINLAALGVTAFIENQAFHQVAGELRYRQTTTQTILVFDSDGDKLPNFEIAFDGKINFALADFIL